MGIARSFTPSRGHYPKPQSYTTHVRINNPGKKASLASYAQSQRVLAAVLADLAARKKKGGFKKNPAPIATMPQAGRQQYKAA